GIYNYCDRWCERCPFTQRCLNFAMQEEDAGVASSDAHDLASGEFWDKLSDIFQQTIELIKESAREAGVDLDSPELRAEVLAHERQVRQREAKNQTLLRAAMDYVKGVDRWMEAAAPAFREKGVELETESRLEVGDPHREAAKLTDFIEVIRWYQPFIYVKLCRAVGSQAEEQIERNAALGAFPKDSDGTAKVVLVALERSIAAWVGLREMLPEQGDAVLDLLRQLAYLRGGTEASFPQARSFVRPGFDDVG
ncbi:MAG: hypothetical protein ABI217_00150, partial [Chthoniobacterales bacterium]